MESIENISFDIIVPFVVFYEKNLSKFDIILYSFLFTLFTSTNKEYRITNNDLAKKFRRSPVTISRSLSRLEKLGYIKRVYGKNVYKRQIKVIYYPEENEKIAEILTKFNNDEIDYETFSKSIDEIIKNKSSGILLN